MAQNRPSATRLVHASELAAGRHERPAPGAFQLSERAGRPEERRHPFGHSLAEFPARGEVVIHCEGEIAALEIIGQHGGQGLDPAVEG